MTDSAANTANPVLTFEGKRYDLNTLPDELKELVRGYGWLMLSCACRGHAQGARRVAKAWPCN